MKLTYEDKVQIYELRKQGFSYSRLANMFGIDARNLAYMIKLIERYGLEIVKKGRNNYYSPEIKQEMIDKVLLEGWSKEFLSNTVSLRVPLFTTGSHNTRKISILLLRKKEGEYLKWDVSQRKKQKR